MIVLQGYIVTKLLYERDNSIYYHGYRTKDNLGVIIKVFKEECNEQSKFALYEHEWHVLNKIHGDTIIKALALEKTEDRLALVYDDFGNSSLNHLIFNKKYSIEEGIIYAQSILSALALIHSYQMIYHHLSPENVLCNTEKKAIKLINFEYCTKALYSYQSITKLRGMPVDKLLYFSPEQTGCINRPIDYRSDYYRAGLVLYELFTKKKPFISQNDNIYSAIYQKITTVPIAPNQINPELPESLSTMIMKLLAIKPEDRYQSITAIQGDLNKCFDNLKNHEKSTFPIAEADYPAHFLISEKMYGAKKAEELLRTCFEASKKLAQCVIISAAHAGYGRSMLVRSLDPAILKSNGYLIQGRYQKQWVHLPYSGLTHAIQQLVAQILSESTSTIKAWRERIEKALGIHASLMNDLFPSLSLLIGEHPPPAKLRPIESQNRFNLAIESFFQALSSSEQPLVIFLDDVQWIDPPSVAFLKRYLSNTQNQNCFIIFSYNEHEVDRISPLSTFIEELKNEQVTYTNIKLNALSQEDAIQLVVDTFCQPKEAILTLAKLCFEKTQGNPLLFKKTLKKMCQENIIYFEKNKWKYLLDEADKMHIPIDIYTADKEQIHQLNIFTQTSVQLASCLEHEFSPYDLSILTGKSLKEIKNEFAEALENEIFISSYSLYFDEKSFEFIDFHADFTFSHNHLKDVAYGLIPKENIAEYHVKIGNYLNDKIHQGSYKSIFAALSQINLAQSLITEPSERLKYAHLNLKAGKKANRIVAYQEAMNFLQAGINYLPENAWVAHFDLTMELYTAITEIAYLSSDFNKMFEFGQILISNAQNSQQKSVVLELNILYKMGQGKIDEALTLGINFLKQLHIHLQRNPNKLRLLMHFIRTKLKLSHKTKEDLYQLPEMQDTECKSKMKILIALAAPAYITDQKLYQLLIFTLVRLSCKYGNASESVIAYATYGTMLCHLGQVEQGYEYGKLAYRLLEKLGAHSEKPKLLASLSFFILPRIQHMNESIDMTVEGIKAGLETGDFAFTGYLCAGFAYLSFLAGKEVNLLKSDLEKYVLLLQKLKQPNPSTYLKMLLQGLEGLLSSTPDLHTKLSGHWFDEHEMMQKFMKTNENIALVDIYIIKLMISFLFNNYEEACTSAEKMTPYINKSIGLFITPHYYFYYALSCLKLSQTPNKKQNLIKLFKYNQKKLKAWAFKAPMNYMDKYCLTEALYAELLGNNKKAIFYFDKAIEKAKTNHFIQIEALANECAATFYLNQKRTYIAKIYLIEAYACYKKWGATAKMAQLQSLYPMMIDLKAENKHPPLATEKAIPVNLESIIHSSNAIAREIELGSLVRTIINEASVYSDAEKVYLLLKKDEHFVIEAEKTKGKEYSILESIPFASKLPQSIIKATIEECTTIMVEDALQDERFYEDPTIQKSKSKSILSLPLVNQGILKGILYFEDNTIGAFTEDKVQVLNLLKASIGIALDHAVLYEHRKNLNEAYDRFVPHAFLDILNKGSIIDVKLGDQNQQNMTVLFCNIKDFILLSQRMNARETMIYINKYISYLEPIITEHHGIIDKYINDTVMAIFKNADDAVVAGLKMLEKNLEQTKENPQNTIHIGINSGLLTLGTVGSKNRMEGTVISDAVNIASRINTLAKAFQVPLLITEYTYQQLTKGMFNSRILDTLYVKGKSIPLTIYEVIPNTINTVQKHKIASIKTYAQAMHLFHEEKIDKALPIFEHILKENENDTVTAYYINRCQELLSVRKK